jgi:hypothetical protein
MHEHLAMCAGVNVISHGVWLLAASATAAMICQCVLQAAKPMSIQSLLKSAGLVAGHGRR